MADIENNVLSPGSHVLTVRVLCNAYHNFNSTYMSHGQWYIEKFRKILGFLDASSQVCSPSSKYWVSKCNRIQLQKNSQVISALRRLFEVAYIPHFDHLKVIHEILIQSDSHDDNGRAIYATRLSDAVDPRTIPEFSRVNIQQKIEAIKLACQTRDFSVSVDIV